MKTNLLNTVMCLALICILGAGGCQEKGPAQSAGERIQEIADNVQHGDPPLKEKGAMEKAGESIDEAIEQEKKD